MNDLLVTHYSCITPVSYTHLKKYYFNSEGAVETNGWILDENGNWYYAKTSGEIVTGDLLINGTPVSYTHLDVYKRQAK